MPLDFLKPQIDQGLVAAVAVAVVVEGLMFVGVGLLRCSSCEVLASLLID